MRAARVASVGLVVALAAAASACSSEAAPRDQWVVEVSTDAHPELGDRLLIEITDETGVPCAACRRQLPFAGAPISLGVVPTGARTFVRARLYRADVIGSDGLPRADAALLDALVELPGLPEGTGIAPVALPLPTDCFGVPADPVARAACDPATRALAPAPLARAAPPLRAGAWRERFALDCASAAPDGSVCVPGGAFVLGDRDAYPGSAIGLPEHLVVISPFYLDTTEVTVGAYRQLRAVHPDLPEPTGPQCTYAADGSRDDRPISCLTWDVAQRTCAAAGKRLPTEAEWEWAAGNLEQETRYPWGGDPDVCAHAAIERADTPYYSLCLRNVSPVPPQGPVAVGSMKDRTSLGVHDLGGNVREWTRDAFALYGEPCWASRPWPIVDPVCDPDANGDAAHVSRGGGFQDRLFAAAGTFRDRGTFPTPANVGVRCAQSSKAGAPRK